MKLKYSAIIALLILLSNHVKCQPLFKKGDRVCFIGNSITQAGEFHHNILLYYATRFPDQRVDFYNCGIAGDVTARILKRINSDILIHQPAYAVIMIGMNDVYRSFYSTQNTTDRDILQKRKNALATYRENLDSIVRIFLSKKVKVILQKPSIYDQTAKLAAKNNYGANDALKICGNFMQELADKYHLLTVDYWSIMNNLNTELQKKDSTATLIGPDRIHPRSVGNMVMSYQFLKTIGSPEYVSKIIINRNTKKSNRQSYNCIIKHVKVKNDILSFYGKEKALPFPIDQSQQQALILVPFIHDLNTELLQVKNLKKGNYKIIIDSTFVGTYTNFQLQQGINLAAISHTPQYKQSLSVRDKLTELWKEEAGLRTIKYVQFDYLKKFSDNQKFSDIEAHLDSLKEIESNT